MIVTIEGIPDCGKSRFANKIMKDFNHVYINDWSLNKTFWTSPISETTEWIVVDDVRNMDMAKALFRSPYLQIEKRGENPRMIPMPNVILISI